ncbi:MAG: hypothetical protein IJU03_04945 [Thermoguttaceae bacterium]|nr:hypothetical protein [Thermoguttaceae bacterium]
MKEQPKGKNGTLVYNEHITFMNIPLKAFEYVVNGRSPIEWLVERNYRRIDKDS